MATKATTKKNEKKITPNFDEYCIPYNGNEPYLFISYSRANSETVYPILKILVEKKFRIWYDLDGIESGEQFKDILREKIKKATAIIFFVSQDSLESKYCGMEVMTATKYDKKIYPVRLDSTIYPTAFSMFLGEIEEINYAERKDNSLKKLIKELPAEAMDRLDIEDGKKLKKCIDNGNEIQIDYGVEEIGESAFKECVKLETVILPETLQEIGNESFRGCSKLRKIDIPENTNKIGESAFRDCVSLKSLKIGNKKIKIGERAFENCAELEEIDLPEGLQEIYGGVFNSCKKLEKIELPKELTILGENAFSDCENLQEIIFPDSVTKVDDLVFNGCSRLKKIKLNHGLRKIGKSAFKNCESLEEIEIPVTVSNISDAPFRGCKKLKSIKVNPKNKWYKSELNRLNGKNGEYVLFNKNKSQIIAYPAASSDETTYDIPDSVTHVGNWTFCDCKNLKKIQIPDSVYEIGEGAFCNCVSLTTIEIPDSVTRIDDCAFRGCTDLTEIIIPSSVADLGWGIFDGCEDTITVYCDEGSAIYEYCRNKGIKEERITIEENA